MYIYNIYNILYIILYCVFLQESYGQQLFDSLAMRLYLVLDQYWQFKQYLKFLDVQPLEYAHDGSHDDSR